MLISIIVPVYNVASHIERCLRSLQTQTLESFEVLLVDDHGPDESMALASQLVGDDPRFRFLATPANGGPGVARNVGLQAARGEYVAFCDADDWVEPSLYARLCDEARAQGCDMVACQALCHEGEGSRRLCNPPYVDRDQYLRHYVAYLWTYLFRREFLVSRQLTFPPFRTSEDSVFLAECLLCADRLSVVDEPLYHYIVYPQSISHRKGVFRGREKLRAFGHLIAFARQRGLWSSHRWTLRLLWLKKGLLTAVVDALRSLRR